MDRTTTPRCKGYTADRKRCKAPATRGDFCGRHERHLHTTLARMPYAKLADLCSTRLHRAAQDA